MTELCSNPVLFIRPDWSKMVFLLAPAGNERHRVSGNLKYVDIVPMENNTEIVVVLALFAIGRVHFTSIE